MLSALLIAHGSPSRPLRRDTVARSLGSLVEACVQGLIGDAFIVSQLEGNLQKIADDAGCALIEHASAAEGLAGALAGARYDRIFVLNAGFAIDRGFVDEVQDALTYGGCDGALTLRATPQTLLTRLVPHFAPAAGLVAARQALQEAGTADLDRLAQRLKGADLQSRARKVF